VSSRRRCECSDSDHRRIPRPRGLSAGSTAALIGGRSARLDGAQSAHAAAEIHLGLSATSGVDHYTDPVDGDAGLRDRSGEDHLSSPLRIGLKGQVLLIGREHPVKWSEHHVVTQAAIQPPLCLEDVAGAGKKHEYITAVSAERVDHGVGHLTVGVATGCRRTVDRGDGKTATLGADHCCRAELLGQRRGVQRCRHDEQLQIGAEGIDGVEREREGGVGVNAALVKLVEDHNSHAFERRIVEQHSG